MKFLPGTVALSLALFLLFPSESPAQSPGGGLIPVRLEPSEFCLFRALRVERTLGTANNYVVSTSAIFKSDTGGKRSANVNQVWLYSAVNLTQPWTVAATFGTALPPVGSYEFNAMLALDQAAPGPGGIGAPAGTGDYQSLPGPHGVSEEEIDFVAWNSGIAYCHASDLETATVIQTARFHGAMGGLFQLDFSIWDYAQEKWVPLKTVPIDGTTKEMVGIDFVMFDLNQPLNADWLGPMNFNEMGCRLLVEAQFALGEETFTKSDIKDVGLWTTGLP